jgi:hypothetical protein
LPAESVTPDAVAPELLHVTACTTSRFPAVTFAAGVNPRLDPLTNPDTFCTNDGAPPEADGVTLLEGLELGLVPYALVAETWNV